MRQAYYSTKDRNNLDRSVARRLIISNHNSVADTFTVDFDSLEGLDFNPVVSGQKWVGYANQAATPSFTIESYDTSTGVFTYSTTGVTNGNAPSNGNSLQLLNPYVNYDNLSETESPIISELTPGATLSAKTIDYSGSSGMIRKTNGTFVLFIGVRFTNNTREIYTATSTDLINWTLNTTPIFTIANAPYAATELITTAINPLSTDDNSLDQYLVLLSAYSGTGDQRALYAIIDEDLNILTNLTQLDIVGYTYGSANNRIRPLAMTQYKGKWRMVVWRADSIYSWSQRLTVEILFDGTLAEILAGTSTNTKNTIWVGTNVQGYAYGAVDNFAYVKNENSLSAFVGITDFSTTDGSYIMYAKRETTIMSLEPDGVTWQMASDGPFICNPTHWQNIDSIYDWQWDHDGGYPTFFQVADDMYFFRSVKGTTDYQIQGLKLKGAGTYADFLPSASGINGADGKTVLNGTVDPTTEGVDGDFYINTTSYTVFGPKTGGAWGAGTSIIGPQGPAGTDGADGAQGPQGIQGIQGPAGTDGIDGDPGVTTMTQAAFDALTAPEQAASGFVIIIT